MRISYNKLWKMLIDKEMNKNDLKDVISNLSISDTFEVKVINDSKEYIRKVKLVEYDGSYIMGIVISEISDISCYL